MKEARAMYNIRRGTDLAKRQLQEVARNIRVEVHREGRGDGGLEMDARKNS